MTTTARKVTEDMTPEVNPTVGPSSPPSTSQTPIITVDVEQYGYFNVNDVPETFDEVVSFRIEKVKEE